MNVALGDEPAQAGRRGRRTEFALAEHVAVSVWCRIPAAGARGRLAGEDDRQEASVRIVAAPSPWGERNYVHGVERAHGLPTARRQARRRHGSGNRYLDNLYEEYAMCVELDGVAAHPEEGRWRDTHRDNANLVQGTDTLRYGWPDATEHRCRTAAEIGAVLRRRGWTGTLRPCGPSCTAASRQSGAGRERAGLKE